MITAILHLVFLAVIYFAFRITYQAGKYDALKKIRRDLEKDNDEY